MVESRFKEGDVVRVRREPPLKDLVGTVFRVDGPTVHVDEMDGCLLAGTSASWNSELVRTILVSRRDWIDLNEWEAWCGPTITSGPEQINKPAIAWASEPDMIGWGFFCGWAASHATFAVGSGSWKKPDKRLTVEIPTVVAEWIEDGFPGVPGCWHMSQLSDAVKDARADAEASR